MDRKELLKERNNTSTKETKILLVLTYNRSPQNNISESPGTFYL